MNSVLNESSWDFHYNFFFFLFFWGGGGGGGYYTESLWSMRYIYPNTGVPNFIFWFSIL
jgi:hypothetical protein